MRTSHRSLARFLGLVAIVSMVSALTLTTASGTLEAGVEILPDYIVSVHEVDDEYCMGIANCVGSEPYDVYLATDLDCVNTGEDFRDTCMVKLTGNEGAEGSTRIYIR